MDEVAKRLEALFDRERGAHGYDGVYAYKYNDGYLFYFSDTVTTRKDNDKLVDFSLTHNSLLFLKNDFSSYKTIIGDKAVISPIENDGSYYWLMDGYLEGNELYLFALKVVDGAPFSLLGSSLLRLTLSNEEDILHQEVVASFPKEIIYGSAIIEEGDCYYVFCYTNEDNKKTFLARTTSLKKLHFLFLQEDGSYSETIDKAFILCSFLGAENKVYRYKNRYWIAYSPYGINKEIRLTSFEKLGEAIKEGKLIYECPEMSDEAIAYNAKIQPAFSSDGRLCISYHVNSLSERRVKETYIYRPHFLEVRI